jgi:hypothetical protein
MDGAADVLAATAHAKLALSGERARLKRRAREQLQEAGWTDELRELCRGARRRPRRPAATARLGPVPAPPMLPLPLPQPQHRALTLAPRPPDPPHAAEHAARCGAAALTHEALVAQVRAAGLARVPDHLKADLLARLRAALEAE